MLISKLEENTEEELKVGNTTKLEMNKTVKQVLEIANISEKNIKEIFKNTNSIKGLIDKIIKLDGKNIDLAKFLFKINYKNYINNFDNSILKNSEILEIILYSDKETYLNSNIKKIINSKLEDNYSKNKKLAFLVLNNFVKSGTSILEVQKFIKNISGENLDIQEELRKNYINYLQKVGNIYQNDLKKNLFKIGDKEILNTLFKSKIINEKGEISKKILKKYSEELNKKFINNDDVDKNSIIDFLLQKIGLTKTQYNNELNLNFLLNSLFKLLKIDKNISNTILKNEESDNKNEKSDNKNEKSKKNIDLEKNNINKNIKGKDEELLEFCNGNCSLIPYSSSYYEINTGFNKIKVNKEDYKDFNSESLENYLNFNQILYEAGLSFLFENKYKGGFIQLLKNKFLGFNYTNGQGFSEYYTLESLNIIAHLVGVPKKYYSGEGKLGKFNSIGEALKIFNEINGTGKINDTKLSNPGAMFSCGASEKRMLSLGILGETGDFSSVKAEIILDKGGYIEDK